MDWVKQFAERRNTLRQCPRFPRWAIPTEGMEQFTPRYSLYCPKARLTTFYRDKGQLHWSHDEGVPKTTAYFVQRADGRIHVVLAGVDYNMLPILEHYLDLNIEAQVIECEIPLRDDDGSRLTRFYVEEPLAFVGDRHPAHQARVDALALLSDFKKEVH